LRTDVLKRQQRRGASGTLAAHEIDFLLGVRRSREEIARLRADGIAYNPLYRFLADSMPVAQFRALWAEHGAALRVEAKRRGIAAPNPDEYGPVDGNRAFWVSRRYRGSEHGPTPSKS